MTSRLKHKLELENVNLKSKHLNESFVQIGTPLPALGDTKKDRQEYQPLWEQEVRDEKGRRRFHGAFTGGFSAGYFNSVGSKEGWAPQQFKSSRGNRAQYDQRAEDFMDEEDLAHMNDDRQLENTETFRQDAFAGTREELGEKSLSGALESLIVPAKTSIGQTLLQKLGWRPGQGLGPRVTHRKLKIQDGKLGRARAGIEEDEEDMEQMYKHTYAPRDSRLLTYTAKDDKEGLGYTKGAGMGRLPARRPMYGATMGDDEDDDPYGAGPSTAMDSDQYVFDNMEEEDEMIVMGGGTSTTASSKPKPKTTGSGDRWHDGRPVLVGFVLDVKGIPPEKWWPFPEIPVDWQPQPSKVWGERPTSEEQVRGAPGQPLTHEERGTALGEEAPVSAAKSVFEFMSEKDRERLQAFAKAAREKTMVAALSLEPQAELTPERATEVEIPPLSPRTASAALQGFIPYGDDPAKQDRYRSYLRSQTYNSKHPNPELLPSTNVDDVNNELASFAASARIFKPMSFAMSSRFTSGSAALATSDMKQAKAGLHVFDPSKAPLPFTTPASTEIEVTKTLSPREQAAADGNFGKLTRVVKEFYPDKLVCRRFHVANPHPEGPREGSGTSTPTSLMPAELMPLPKNDASWESKFIHQSGTDRENTPPEDTQEPEERAPRNLAEVGMAEDANQGRDILTYTKPSIDIFKAIFASDDEDEDDEEDDKAATTKVVATTAASAPKDPYPVDEKPVDYATFKPVFLPGGGDDEKGGKEESAKDKDKKKKKDKKKRKGALSFDVGDDEGGDVEVKPKKKARARERPATIEEEWVEKAPPVPARRPEACESEQRSAAAAGPSARNSRKGAADLW